MTDEKVIPVSLGVMSEPPTLILLYEDEPGGRRRRRRMPVRHFNDVSDVARAAFAIRQRHEKWLKDVTPVTVERLLRIVQELIKGLSKEEAVAVVDSEFSVGTEEDLNVVGEDVLRRKKGVMEEQFRRLAVLPGDPEYVWDKQEDFGAPKSPSGWDEDSEEPPQDLQNIPETDENPPASTSPLPLHLESSKDLKLNSQDSDEDDFWA